MSKTRSDDVEPVEVPSVAGITAHLPRVCTESVEIGGVSARPHAPLAAPATSIVDEARDRSRQTYSDTHPRFVESTHARGVDEAAPSTPVADHEGAVDPIDSKTGLLPQA